MENKSKTYEQKYLYHEGRWYLLQEDVEEILNSEISKAKIDVLKKCRKIYMDREKMSKFIESELDKLSNKRE